MIIIATTVLHLILVHDPQGAALQLNPVDIIVMRPAPTERRGHYDERVQCLINTADGKSIPVIETCEQVKALIAALNGGK